MQQIAIPQFSIFIDLTAGVNSCKKSYSVPVKQTHRGEYLLDFGPGIESNTDYMKPKQGTIIMHIKSGRTFLVGHRLKSHKNNYYPLLEGRKTVAFIKVF